MSDLEIFSPIDYIIPLGAKPYFVGRELLDVLGESEKSFSRKLEFPL